ncbi:hypothetical protein [Paraconexibacter sp.]|uniref:hypothetical protein n=1 Tax=Paraconexibacter sp. TaxID=2949640 RepID=UPI0035631DCB
MPAVRRLFLVLPLLLLAGCGGGDDTTTGSGESPAPRGPASAELRQELARATKVDPADFPATEGRTLRQVADGLNGTGTSVGLATSILPAPSPRLGFGVLDGENAFVYAPTVVYLARSENGKAAGPFPAPADLLVTDPPFRSRQAASEKDPFAAVYAATLEARPGTYKVLVVSKVKADLVGATAEITVVDPKDDPVPAPGEKAPAVETDTAASAGGDLSKIDTRLPPSDMHEVSLKDVVGKEPVALLFATPQLCQSRVCGPVADIALQLKKSYGDRMTFIHQEVYVDNELNKGLRPPLQAFNLPTEPWLFTIRKDGTIAARLEGSFGFAAFEQAIKAAL